MKSNLFTLTFIVTCAFCLYFSLAENTILDRYLAYTRSEQYKKDKNDSVSNEWKNFQTWDSQPRWKSLKDLPEAKKLRKNMYQDADWYKRNDKKQY